MRALAVSVLVDLKDRFSRGLGGLQRKLAAFGRFGRRMGLKRLAGQFANVGREVFTLGKRLAALAGLGGGGLLWMVNQSSAAATEVDNMAKRAGIAAGALQELAYAGSTRGVGMDALVDGLKELQLRADEFIITGKGSAADAFKRIGLSADDLAQGLQQPDQLFQDIIGRMEGLDKAAQIRIADELFGGTGGEQFVQMIELGADGIEGLRQKARDLGLVFSDQQLDNLRQYNLSVKELTDTFKGLTNTLSAELAPVFKPLIESATAWVQANKPAIIEHMTKAAESLASGLEFLTGWAGNLAGNWFDLETAGLAIAALFTGKLIVAIGTFAATLLTTPVGWFLLAVTGIALAAKWIYDNWDGIGEWFSELWETITAGVSVAWDHLKEVLSWHPLALIVNNWSEILDWFARFGDKAAAAVTGAAHRLSAAGSSLMQALWDGLKAKFAELMAWVAEIPGRIMAHIKSIDLKDIIRQELPPILGGYSEAEKAARIQQQSAAGELGRIAGAGAAARTFGSPDGNDLQKRPQEAKVGGVISVQITGPANVTGVKNLNKDVPIKVDRGASAVLE